MKKFWALLAWLIFLPLNFSSAAEPDIAIGLVQNQFSAEVVAASDFVVTDNAGTTLSSLPKGKYFLHLSSIHTSDHLQVACLLIRIGL